MPTLSPLPRMTGVSAAGAPRHAARTRLGRVLIEGGGRTVSDFLAAGLLDRLYLTTAPILIGDGIPGVRFAGADLLADALAGSIHRFSLGRDICTVFDFAAARQ